MSSGRWRVESSRQGSRASRPTARPAVCPRRRILVGDETGPPLIQCPECGQARVIQLRAWTEENYGRVFFKCPTNVQGDPTTCPFFEWQKKYLKKLVELGKVTLYDVVADDEGEGEVEAESIPSSARQMQSQMENLISIVKLLVLVLGGLLIVGIMYLIK